MIAKKGELSTLATTEKLSKKPAIKPPSAAIMTNRIVFLCIRIDGNRLAGTKKGVAL